MFCTLAKTLPTSNEARYFRDFTQFNQNAFLLDLSSIDFKTLVNADVNESMSNILNNLRTVTNRHAPVHKASRQKKKQLEKSWVSKAVLASIKRKNKLFQTHFWSTDPRKQQEYKTYSNKLNKIIIAARKSYLAEQFELNRDNIKSTWKLIGLLIDRRKNNSQLDKQSICNQLNNYFSVSVGEADPLVYADSKGTSLVAGG